MASPRPSSGIGITAMAAAPDVERAQGREQVGRRFDEIAGRAEVDHRPGMIGHIAPERQQGLAWAHLAGVEPQGRGRRVVPRQHAGRRRLAGLALATATGHAQHAGDVLARNRAQPQDTMGSSPVASTTVDSRPTGVAPPSRIMATRSPRSASTCAAVVGLTCPERLALGAAMGGSPPRSRAWATGCAGTRTRDGIEPRGRQLSEMRAGRFASTRVSGPGQNAAASCSAIGVSCAIACGCRVGHVHDQRIEARPPLGGEDAATARPLVASAPSP